MSVIEVTSPKRAPTYRSCKVREERQWRTLDGGPITHPQAATISGQITRYPTGKRLMCSSRTINVQTNIFTENVGANLFWTIFTNVPLCSFDFEGFIMLFLGVLEFYQISEEVCCVLRAYRAT